MTRIHTEHTATKYTSAGRQLPWLVARAVVGVARLCVDNFTFWVEQNC